MIATSTTGRDDAIAEIPSVLICGASFAGLASAYWMVTLGYAVTIVESAGAVRKGGTPVDLEGEAIDILARMGLIDAVRAAALPPRSFKFKDAEDTALGGFDAAEMPDDQQPSRYEIHRDDLLDILLAAVDGSVALRFGRSVVHLEESLEAVTATFDDGSKRDFSIVLGCDGNRSRTRRLIFGDTAASFFMGGYFFLKVVPQVGLISPNMSETFSVAGRTAMLNGYADRTDIGLAFRTTQEVEYDHRDRSQQRRLIHEHFDGLGWKVPAMLSHVDDGDDFYFDRINQIRIPTWFKGRVVLVGDAGYCVSPVAGLGGSMALIGAARLADSLRHHPGDHGSAFARYQDGLQPFVIEVQQQAAGHKMSLLFPATDVELVERDRILGEGGFAV